MRTQQEIHQRSLSHKIEQDCGITSYPKISVQRMLNLIFGDDVVDHLRPDSDVERKGKELIDCESIIPTCLTISEYIE